MTRKQEKLTKLLYTANQWSSDQPGNGLALLSLGTTRKVHNKRHRQEIIKEIDACLHYLLGPALCPGSVVDAADLRKLKKYVSQVMPGKEWLSDQEYMECNEILFQAGELT